MNMAVSSDANPRAGVKVAEEIHLVGGAELLGMVLHSGRPSDIPIHKNCSFFHLC